MYTLRAIDSSGAHLGVLTDFSKLQSNIEFSDVGNTTFDYAIRGTNANLLVAQREMALFFNDQEVPDTRFILEDSNGNLVQRENVLYRSWGGRNLWKLFDESCTFPPNWPTATPIDSVFNNRTPGYILRVLIQRSQSRGELPGITRNFTDTLDADGNAWAFSLSVTFEVGTPLLSIIRWLIEQRYIEARMVGRELEVYNPDGLGQDLTIGSNPVVFWSTEPIEEVPEAMSSRELRTVALMVGDDGVVQEVVDATAVAQYGRRVLPIKQGGITDAGTLTALGQLNIDKVKTPRRERTTKMAIVPGQLRPMFDFTPGDWVFSQTEAGVEKMRVRQVVIDVPDVQTDSSATLRLNDKFEELEVELNRKIEGITGGSQLGGGGTGVPTDPGTADTMPPAIPTGLGLSSITYVQGGITAALLSGSWNPVTTNQDGSPITDFDGYRFAWRYTNEPTNASWHVVSNGDDTTAIVSGLIPGRNVEAKVGAVDRNGNFSGYSSSVTIALAEDNSPPPTPSTPLVEPYLGQLRIYWDGLGSFGENMPLDFQQIEVHVSQVNDFTPDGSTMVGSMISPGYFIVTNLTYGIPYYVKLIARDRNQNASAASAQGVGTPQPVSGADLADGAVFLNHLAFSDVGNFIEDGSFEKAEVRAERLVGGPWSYASDDAYQGAWSVKAAGTGALSASNNLLTAHVPIRPGDDFMASYAVKLDTTAWNSMVADTQAVGIQLVVRLANGSTTATSIFGPRKQDLEPNNWLSRFSVKIASQTDWRAIEEIYLWRMSNVGAGNIWVDAVEVRQLLGSVHIANLAVNDAAVANLSAGKIISGLLNADVVMGGRIVAGDIIGSRVDMDVDGIRLFKGAVTLQTANDTFTRVVADAWGTIPSGNPGSQVWSLGRWYGTSWGGSTANFDVDGSYGTMVMATVGTSEGHDSMGGIWPVSTSDCAAQADIYLPEVAVGASYRVGIGFRRAASSPFDQGGVLVELFTSGIWNMSGYRITGGTRATAFLNSGGYEPGWYRLKARLAGLGTSTRVEGKLWRIGVEPEPEWQSAGNSSYPQTAGTTILWASRAPGNTNSNMVIKWDNVQIRGYLTGAVETVRIATSGTIYMIGELRTGYLTEKRIRIDANATFNNESGITFDDPVNSDAFSPTVFANYVTFEGGGRGGLHVMSGEQVANSSGRARLSVYKGGGWDLLAEFDNGARDSRITASRDLNFRTGDEFFYYGAQLYQPSGVTAQQSMYMDRVDVGTTTAFTYTYGPTMSTTPIPFITPDTNVAVRWRNSSLSTTSFGVTYESSSGAWRFLVVRS